MSYGPAAPVAAYAPKRRNDWAPSGANYAGRTWDLSVRITAPGQTYTVDINAGTSPEIKIDWGDGVIENFTSTGQKTHTYYLVRTHTVRISGRFRTGGNIQLGSNSANRARLVGTGVIPLIPGLANFISTFSDCTGITTIPEDLFRYNPQVTANAFNSVFSRCSGLTSIPKDLFRYNTRATTSVFRSAFYLCTGIKSIPVDLFRYNTLVTSSAFYQAFYGCTGITSIPDDLFRYNTLVSTSGMYGVFQGCTGITSIPTDLFRYNTAVSTSGFQQTFYGCTGLTSIPTDLFRYNTAVTTSGFSSALYGCTGLTSLPTDLFRYNTLVSSSGFSSAFYGCTGLTSLPTDLFRYNTACTSWNSTFEGCVKLQQNANIFYQDGAQATRFLNQTVDFTECFKVTSFTGTTGVAPDLWNCDFGTETATKTDCWQGHSVSTVSNFGDIPAAWT